MRHRYVHRHGTNRVKRLRLGALLCVVAAAVGFTIYGTTGGGARHPVAVAAPVATNVATTTTVAHITTTTVGVTTTTIARTMLPTTHPITVDGGSFTCVNGYVTLTHIVAPGENLSVIAQWFYLMAGWQGLYLLNRSVVGVNPDLIYPGERLTVVVSAATVPHISPMFLADSVR